MTAATLLAALQVALQYGPSMVTAVLNIIAEAKAVLSSPDQAALDQALTQIKTDNEALFAQVDAELAAAALR